MFAGGPRRGGGSCFRSRRVLRCEPCKRRGEGWRVCPATTVGPGRDLLPDVGQMFGQGEKGKRKKNRFRTTNLNLKSNDTSCLCKFAAFDPLIVDLTAASGATDSYRRSGNFNLQAWSPGSALRADDDFCQMSRRASGPCKPHFVSLSGGNRGKKKYRSGSLGLRFSNKIMPRINIAEIYIPEQSRYASEYGYG